MPIAIGRRSSRSVPPSVAKARAGARASDTTSPCSSLCGSTRSDWSGSSVGSSNALSCVSNASDCSAHSPSEYTNFRTHSKSPSRRDEGVDLCGPFSAEIVTDASPECRSSSYTLRIKGIDGDHLVRRRYSLFAELSDGLDQQGVRLPRMPPKSFFRRRLSSGFREDRLRALAHLLAAAVDADPFATDPSLRSFLGLSKVEHGEGKALSRGMPRVLSVIDEFENESQGSSHTSYTWARPSCGAHDATPSAEFFEIIHDEPPNALMGPRPCKVCLGEP